MRRLFPIMPWVFIISLAIFVVMSMSSSRPRLHSAGGGSDPSALINAITALVIAISGLFPYFFKKRDGTTEAEPAPKYFREVGKNYQGDTVTVEIKDRDRDGEPIWVEIDARPVRDN